MHKFLVLVALFLPFAAHAEVPCPSPQPGVIHIASFNVYRLGKVAPKYAEEGATNVDPNAIPERVASLANVLAVGQFDLVVFQEVAADTPGDLVMADLVAVLSTHHGLAYEYFVSDYIGAGFQMREAISFMYDPETIEPETVGSAGTLSENIEIDGRDLVLSRWSAGNFDFTLVAAHLAWGNESARDDGYQKVDHIFTAPRPSQFSIDDDIVILGDFNRFGKEFDSVKELEFDGTFFVPNVAVFDPAFNEIVAAKADHLAGKGIPDDDPQWVSTTVASNTRVYDMILLSPDAAEEYTGTADGSGFGTDWGILHFDEVGGCGYQPGAEHLSHDDLKHAYSDHRPLWMRFRTDGDTADN